MAAATRQKIEAAGWKIGAASELPDLSAEEAAFVEITLALSQTMRTWRTRKRLTQVDLAKQRRSRPSRVARMGADPSVSVDLLL